jgi:predicted nuclease with TOPRIM domain
MKALELLKELIINMSSLNEDGYKFGRIRTYKAIQELEALEIKLKQGQDNYDKLWDMYSELKKENKELEEEMRNLTTELILNMLKENK